MDKNQDGKATFEEVKEYLAKYNTVIKDSEVERFIARRDMNGNGKKPRAINNFMPRNITPTMVLKKKLLLIFMRIGNILTLISPVFDLLKMKCEILIYIYVTLRITISAYGVLEEFFF